MVAKYIVIILSYVTLLKTYIHSIPCNETGSTTPVVCPKKEYTIIYKIAYTIIKMSRQHVHGSKVAYA